MGDFYCSANFQHCTVPNPASLDKKIATYELSDQNAWIIQKKILPSIVPYIFFLRNGHAAAVEAGILIAQRIAANGGRLKIFIDFTGCMD